MEYTFNPGRRQDAILLAAKIAFDGKESTVHCGGSHFGGAPEMDFVEEYRDGAFVQRHYYRTELQGHGWVFCGMVTPQTQTETTTQETKVATMDEPRFTDEQTARFFAHALEIARANLAQPLPGYTARDAAREALQEAHSALSQPSFFGMVDALGGHAALMEQLEAALLAPETPEPQPHFTIHPATLADIRSLGIRAQVGTLPQDAPITYWRVQVDNASEWIDLAMLPTGALLAWGGNPAFLEGASTPEEALEQFFAEKDEEERFLLEYQREERFFLEYQRWGMREWVRVPLGGTWALTATECDAATGPIQALFSDLRWRRVPAPRA